MLPLLKEFDCRVCCYLVVQSYISSVVVLGKSGCACFQSGNGNSHLFPVLVRFTVLLVEYVQYEYVYYGTSRFV